MTLFSAAEPRPRCRSSTLSAGHAGLEKDIDLGRSNVAAQAPPVDRLVQRLVNRSAA
jgi:hypothetical protein